jgi:hypothetical protein
MIHAQALCSRGSVINLSKQSVSAYSFSLHIEISKYESVVSRERSDFGESVARPTVSKHLCISIVLAGVPHA